MPGRVRFKVRQAAVEPPCSCGSASGIYRTPLSSAQTAHITLSNKTVGYIIKQLNGVKSEDDKKNK